MRDVVFWDRVKQPSHWGQVCDECGDCLKDKAFYEMGVNTRLVTLCLSCAHALHREAKRKGMSPDSLLLERY